MPDQSESQLKEFVESQLKERSISRIAPPGCGIVWARNDTRNFTWFYPPLPGDLSVDRTIDEDSTSDEIDEFDDLLVSLGMGFSPGVITQGTNLCAAYQPIRFLKCQVDYTGSVYGHLDGVDAEGEVSLHSFAYLHLQEYRFEYPLGLYHERATNIAGTTYDWSIDLDDGAVTQVGSSYSDALDTYPNIGESSIDPYGPAALPGGSARLRVVPTYDNTEPLNPRLTQIVATLTMTVPANYYEPGSPSHTRTLQKTFTVPMTWDEFEAACNLMLDSVQLTEPGHVYTDDDSKSGWPSESIAPYNRRLMWGDQYNVKWSCEENIWPNRIIVVYTGTSLPSGSPSEFLTLAAERNATLTSLSLLRSRAGVASGDTGCYVDIGYTVPEYVSESASIFDDPRECLTLSAGGDPDPVLVNCTSGVAPGHYYLTTNNFLGGQRYLARRYQSDTGGLCALGSPACIDVLETWDGTNPDPAGTDGECCWPDPP